MPDLHRIEDLPPLAGQTAITRGWVMTTRSSGRSEEHTSELQSPCNLVCRLLLEKKKKHHDDVAHSRIVALLRNAHTVHALSKPLQQHWYQEHALEMVGSLTY